MDTRPARQPTRPFGQVIDTNPTPLERRFQSQDGFGESTSNAEQTALLRDILRELKAIREGSESARTEQKPQEE
jgi:hypothetical protein